VATARSRPRPPPACGRGGKVTLVPETPLEEAQDMLARAKAIGARVRENEQVILDMSTEELEELRTDLSDSVAAASAAIAQIKTLLAARDSE
jgi:tryptophan 2,3-dioxygenase